MSPRMAKLDIITLPDPLLRKASVPVERVDDDLQRLIDDMFETMYAAPGVGLAAVQVGVPRRLIVLDIGDGDEAEGEEEKRNPIVMINPEIVRLGSEPRLHEEGCLSIPDVYADVERSTRVVVRALDRDGKPFEVEAEDLLARCMQHEIDHLFGTLFIDHLSVLKRRSALSKWTKEKEKYPGLIRRMSAEDVAAHHHRDEEL
jgi:peptide deformylase